MTRKTKTQAKRKYIKRAPRWNAARQRERIVAARSEGPEVSKIVGDAIQCMAAADQAALSVWQDRPQEPGLHVMRTGFEGTYEYNVVRVVEFNNGVSHCFKVGTPNGEEQVHHAVCLASQYQKVGE